MKKARNDPDLLDEYDFSGGVRGKYAKRYAEGTTPAGPVQEIDVHEAIERGLENSDAGRSESVREMRKEYDLPE
jgi:hypothetical protein